MARMRVVNVTQTTATVECYGAGPASRTRYWYFRCNNETQLETNMETSAQTTFSGLSPGTSYTAECKYGPDPGNPKFNGGSIPFTTESVEYANYDDASYNYLEDYTSIDLVLYNITSRDYPRTVTFEWYNTSSGNSGEPTETLLPNETRCPRSMINLTIGTTYRFRITITNPAGVITYDSGYFYVATKSYSSSDYGNYSYTAGFNNVHLYLSYITSREYERTVYYYWENTRTGGSGTKNKPLLPGETSSDRDMPGLTMGDQYKFRIYVTNPVGDISYDTGYFYVTTLSYDYELSMALSSTYNSITVTVTLNKTLSYDIDLTVQLDGGRDLDISISAGSITRSRTWTSNITAATAYKVTLIDNTRNKKFNSTKRTKNNFHWSTNVSAGLKFDLKASDWNELTDQLSSKCAYFSVTVNSFTSATKGKQLTAGMYNQVARAINALVGKGDCVTSVPSVSKGGPIMADSLQLLASCLNE